MSAWHAKRTEEVLKELGTGRRSGLSEAEAGKRLGRYGRNELEHQEPEGMLRRFLAQMRAQKGELLERLSSARNFSNMDDEDNYSAASKAVRQVGSCC